MSLLDLSLAANNSHNIKETISQQNADYFVMFFSDILVDGQPCRTIARHE